VLVLKAVDPAGREIYTWSWPVSLPEKKVQKIVPQPEKGQID